MHHVVTELLCVILNSLLLGGGVKWQTYWEFIKAAGGLPVVMTILLAIGGAVALTLYSNFWLSHWIDAGSGFSVSHTVTQNIDLFYCSIPMHDPITGCHIASSNLLHYVLQN